MPRELANAPTSSLENTATINTGVSSSPTRPTVRDSSWLELDVCREFLRDSCSRTAEECKYAHPTGSVVIKDGNKVTCCFDYLKDRCSREMCKYLHPSVTIKDKLILAGKQYGQALAVTTKTLLPPPLSPAIQPVSLGGAFQLPLSFINPNISASSIGTSSNFSHSPPPHISPVSQKIPLCEEFEVDQNCSKGDICLYAHPGPYVRRNNDNTVTVCWNFINGYCRHQNCWFYHPPLLTLSPYFLSQPLIDNVVMSPFNSPLNKLPPNIGPYQMSPYPLMMSPHMIPISTTFPPTFSPNSHNTSSISLPQAIVN